MPRLGVKGELDLLENLKKVQQVRELSFWVGVSNRERAKEPSKD